MIVLSAVSGSLTDWLEPTARNSKRLPVKANGLVRLRSPASRRELGQRVDADLERALALRASSRRPP